MQKWSIFLITLFLFGCATAEKEVETSINLAPDAEETEPAEQPSEDEQTTEDETNTEDETMSDEALLENATNLVIDAINDMSNWNSFSSTSSATTQFTSTEFNSEYIRYIQFVRAPFQVYIDTHSTGTMVQRVEQYGVQYEDGSYNLYENNDSATFEETEAPHGMTKDHIQIRKNLLAFALGNSNVNDATAEDSTIVLNITLNEDQYEKFAELFMEILEVTVPDLDIKSNFVAVRLDLVLDGLNLFGYTVRLQYTPDDIDGAEELYFLENIETINDFNYIEAPFSY
jgi:hypothetical protein